MIRLLIPHMPQTDALIPYLRRIDATQHFVNFGPGVQELERRISERFGGAHVVTVSSGTAALELAFIRARMNGTTEVTVPALTFPATALAAHRAGLRVRLVDVDKETWLAEGADVPVCAFGCPVIPRSGAIVDAAGAFGSQIVMPGRTYAFSLHATKVLGCGEGGFLVTHDADEANDYRRMSNFGMVGGVSRGMGTNAKMSEYHAAVALAALDQWHPMPWEVLHHIYEAYLPRMVTSQVRPKSPSAIMAVALPCPAGPVAEYMAEHGIETRRWYYPPLYRHPLFEAKPLPNTEWLSERLLGLPYHLRLQEHEIPVICSRLAEGIDRTLSRRIG